MGYDFEACYLNILLFDFNFKLIFVIDIKTIIEIVIVSIFFVFVDGTRGFGPLNNN